MSPRRSHTTLNCPSIWGKFTSAFAATPPCIRTTAMYEACILAPANQSETTHFEASINGADFKPTRAYTDKGFASRAKRAHLDQRPIRARSCTKRRQTILCHSARKTPISASVKSATSSSSALARSSESSAWRGGAIQGQRNSTPNLRSKRCVRICSRQQTKFDCCRSPWDCSVQRTADEAKARE
jgi:hypothetical protein